MISLNLTGVFNILPSMKQTEGIFKTQNILNNQKIILHYWEHILISFKMHIEAI